MTLKWIHSPNQLLSTHKSEYHSCSRIGKRIWKILRSFDFGVEWRSGRFTFGMDLLQPEWNFLEISSNPFLHLFPTWLGQDYWYTGQTGPKINVVSNSHHYEPVDMSNISSLKKNYNNKYHFNWIGKRIWIDLDPFLRNGILGGLECIPKKRIWNC